MNFQVKRDFQSLQNNVGQDLFVDIKNSLDREKWMLHIRTEPSGSKRGAENYIIIINHFKIKPKHVNYGGTILNHKPPS